MLGGAEVHALGQEDLALQEAPVGPHVHLFLDVTVGVQNVEVRRPAQPLHCCGVHAPAPTTTCSHEIGPWSVSTAVTDPDASRS